MTLADWFVTFLSCSRLDFLLLYFASCVTADLKLEVVELEIVALFFFFNTSFRNQSRISRATVTT